MSKKKTDNLEIIVTGAQFSIKFGHIILPFDIFILGNRLATLGYNTEISRQNVPTSAVTGKVRIAIKDDMEVSFNNDKQVLTMMGQDPDSLSRNFTNLFETLSELAKPIDLKIDFYEIIISALVRGSKNPLEVFSMDGNQLKKGKDFESLFGESVSPFGIRLAPSNTQIDNPNWFEFRLEPFTLQPSWFYLSAYIFRNENRAKTIDSLNAFVSYTEKMIKLIET